MATKKDETLGRRIARMRLRNGMTQERLANIANVSAQAVSKWENDQSYPDILLLPIIATTFGITVDELLGVVDAAPVQETTAEAAQAVKVPITVDEEIEPLAAAHEDEQPTTANDDWEMEPDTEPLPDTPETSDVEDVLDIDGPATHIRIHVIQRGMEAVNIAIPLAAARLFSNIAEFVPDQVFDGIDLVGIAQNIQNAGKGTLVDIDDGHDRVIITLE